MASPATNGDLRGKRVLITGGGRGIGRAIAFICAEEGAQVAVLSRTRDEVSEVAEEISKQYGRESLAVCADVTKEDEVASAVAQVVEKFGGIDLLVNNVGQTTPKAPAHKQSAEAFRQLLDVNVVSALIVSSAVLNQCMLAQKSGLIINVSSRAGKIGIAQSLPYCASKFALEGLTLTLAEELRDSGIRVNSISPGMVDTQTFPKTAGTPGVRTAESVRDGFLHLCRGAMTGRYLHVDEFDQAAAANRPELAAKPIEEPKFTVA